jgi:nitroreductase
MDVIEAMETCSAARYLKPDPVPQDLIERVIYAATRASSPGNSQARNFIVVRDRELKQKIRNLIAPPIPSYARKYACERPDHQ